MGACPSDLAGPECGGPPASTDELKEKQTKVRDAGLKARAAKSALESARKKLKALQDELASIAEQLNLADVRISDKEVKAAAAKPDAKAEADRQVAVAKAEKNRLIARQTALNKPIADADKSVKDLEPKSTAAETEVSTAKRELDAALTKAKDTAAATEAKRIADEEAAREAERLGKEAADAEVERLKQVPRDEINRLKTQAEEQRDAIINDVEPEATAAFEEIVPLDNRRDNNEATRTYLKLTQAVDKAKRSFSQIEILGNRVRLGLKITDSDLKKIVEDVTKYANDIRDAGIDVDIQKDKLVSMRDRGWRPEGVPAAIPPPPAADVGGPAAAPLTFIQQLEADTGDKDGLNPYPRFNAKIVTSPLPRRIVNYAEGTTASDPLMGGDIPIDDVLADADNPILLKSGEAYYVLYREPTNNGIADGSLIKYACIRDLPGIVSPIDVYGRNPFVYITGPGGGNYMVLYEELKIVLEDPSIKAIELTPRDVIQNVSSFNSIVKERSLNYLGVDLNEDDALVGADHCQAGTDKPLYSITILNLVKAAAPVGGLYTVSIDANQPKSDATRVSRFPYTFKNLARDIIVVTESLEKLTDAENDPAVPISRETARKLFFFFKTFSLLTCRADTEPKTFFNRVNVYDSTKTVYPYKLSMADISNLNSVDLKNIRNACTYLNLKIGKIPLKKEDDHRPIIGSFTFPIPGIPDADNVFDLYTTLEGVSEKMLSNARRLDSSSGIEFNIRPGPTVTGGQTRRRRKGGNDPVQSETQRKTTKRELEDLPKISPKVRDTAAKLVSPYASKSLPKGGRRRTFRKKKTLRELEKKLDELKELISRSS